MVLLLTALAACNQREPAHIEDPEDEIPPKEAQSDFIDIGKQAGIEWLSFVPNAEREYPSLYQGLDRDQKRRVKLAPRERPDERVLLEFELTAGSKIWPVEWYGTELIAVDVPNAPGLSVAIANTTKAVESIPKKLADLRAAALNKEEAYAGRTQVRTDSTGNTISLVMTGSVNITPIARFSYAARRLQGTSTSFVLVAEWKGEEIDTSLGVDSTGRLEPSRVLDRISIKRELAIEGLPKHSCTSSISELKNGVLKYPKGAITLPTSDGHAIRKVGGDSTVQIDGHGAKPWVLIRRLSETSAPGDLRVRVRNDAVFQRRLDNTGASLSAGYTPDGSIPAVFWDYRDAGSEQVTVGVLKVGGELLTVEIISTGLRDGDTRRKARQAALDLLAGATAEPNNEAPEFRPLIGWNVGTMGRND